MRRKSDMWRDVGGFLPDETKQEAEAAATDVRDRLATVEEQLKSQFTSMSAYHQIAQQAVEVARAEARADLDREKSTIVSLIERVRVETTGNPIHATPATDDQPIHVSVLARLALMEDRFEQLTQQFGQCLRSQEELANSLAFLFEQQLRHATELSADPAS